MAKQNIYGGDAVLEPVKALTNQSDRADDLVDQQWGAYTRARDAGHLEWVEEARDFDNYYYGDQREHGKVPSQEQHR